MAGRGIDQILPHPSETTLHEDYVKSALRYLELAEKASGRIPRPVDFSYVWGDALAELERFSPDARIINLETAITRSERHWEKGINYRMSPENAPILEAAGIDACALANNHVLDWGYSGLEETLDSLSGIGAVGAGAGRDIGEAEAPRIIHVGRDGRVLLLSCCTVDAGIPAEWAAGEGRPGVNLLSDLSGETVASIGSRIGDVREEGDVVVASIHWGGNWGYGVPEEHRLFAHRLIDDAGVDLVHGHSSHHVKGIEVYGGRLILYGCGDFINDYEGIGGYEAYRGDLGLMYFASVRRCSGELISLEMIPTRMRRFRVNRAGPADASWLIRVLDKEGSKYGTSVKAAKDGNFSLRW
jgi:poly-gamma-glutamate synthesis protein (capsule biosynthesis protein)